MGSNRYRIRELCRLTLAMRDMGIFDTRGAAAHLAAFNVPLQVALRLLAGRRP